MAEADPPTRTLSLGTGVAAIGLAGELMCADETVDVSGKLGDTLGGGVAHRRDYSPNIAGRHLQGFRV